MNSVSMPSMAATSFTNRAISALRSTKPRPEVCTVRSELTTVFALSADGAVRDIDFDEVMSDLSPRRPCESRAPYSATSRFWPGGADASLDNQQRWLWIPALAGTTSGSLEQRQLKSCR